MSIKYYYVKTHFNMRMRFRKEGVDIEFMGGKYSTDDPRTQALIENSAMYKNGVIISSEEDKPSTAPKVEVVKGTATTETAPGSKGKSKKTEDSEDVPEL